MKRILVLCVVFLTTNYISKLLLIIWCNLIPQSSRQGVVEAREPHQCEVKQDLDFMNEGVLEVLWLAVFIFDTAFLPKRVEKHHADIISAESGR